MWPPERSIPVVVPVLLVAFMVWLGMLWLGSPRHGVAVASEMASGGHYITVMAGASSWITKSNDDELEADSQRLPMLAIALGRALGRVRLEVELAGRYNKVHGINPPGVRSSGDGNRLFGISLFANAAYDFPPLWRLEPYVMAGAGPTLLVVREDREQANARDIEDEALTLSAQAGAGVRMALTGRLDLDLGLRLLYSLPTDINGLETNYFNDAATVGLAYRF